MQWYYFKNGAQFGPVDDAEIHRMARSKEISPDDFVWNETMGGEWQRASKVSDLFPPPGDQPPDIPEEPFSANPVSGTTSNRDLMRMARASLRGRWGMAILAILTYAGVIVLIAGIEMAVVAPASIHAHQALPHPKIEIPLATRLIGNGIQLLQFMITGPLVVGLVAFFLNVARQAESNLSDVFSGFLIFWKSVGTYFLIMLLTLGWMLLFFIPALGLWLWAATNHQVGYNLPTYGIGALAVVGYIIVLIKILSYMLTWWALADNPSLGPLQAIRQSKRIMQGRKWKFICLCFRFFGWMLLTILTCGIGMLWVYPYMITSFSLFYLDGKGRD